MKAKSLQRTQTFFSLIYALLIFLAILMSYRAGFFTGPDHFLYDLYYKWRGPQTPSGKIALVLMDEASANELSRQKGNWSRRHMAQALDNLCGAGAEVIGLDMIFSAPDSEPGADLELAGAIERCNNVVMARVSAAKGVEEIVPLPIFQAGMIGDGFIDLPLDDDDILRKVRFFTAKVGDEGVTLLPAFALELVRTYFNIDFALDFSDPDYFTMGGPDQRQLRLPYPELLINFQGDHSVFATLSFAEAVAGRFEPEKVRGKIVLIGSTLASQKDFFNTSYTRFQPTDHSYREKFGSLEQGVLGDQDPGVACHAHAVETIAGELYIQKVKPATQVTLLAGLTLFCLLFYLTRLGMFWEIVLLGGSLLLVSCAGYLSFLEKRLWIETAPLLSLILAQFVGGMVVQKSFDKKKTALVTSLFGKYVSPGVVGELIRGDISDTLEGQRQKLTMLFSDLRGFTTISEQLGAKETSQLLNIYFDRMIPIVFAHEGTLDKLMGDAVMAFFGAPLPVDNHPVKAAEAALHMVESLAELRSSDIPGAEKLKIGIGLNTGVVTVGNLGSQAFMDYTIIGDDVNLASRLEGINKVYGTTVIISEFTAAELDDRFVLRNLDTVKVKGKERAVTIYELVGFRNKVSPQQLGLIATFEQGTKAYRARQWDTAANLFTEILATQADNLAASLYLQRIAQMRQNPPPADWDGITVFDHK